jgi:hypothetical protein
MYSAWRKAWYGYVKDKIIFHLCIIHYIRISGHYLSKFSICDEPEEASSQARYMGLLAADAD